MSRSYACEKHYDALLALMEGPYDIFRQRLVFALYELATLRDSLFHEIPCHLQKDFAELMDEMTSTTATADEGTITATVMMLEYSNVRKVIERVLSLYTQIVEHEAKAYYKLNAV